MRQYFSSQWNPFLHQSVHNYDQLLYRYLIYSPAPVLKSISGNNALRMLCILPYHQPQIIIILTAINVSITTKPINDTLSFEFLPRSHNRRINKKSNTVIIILHIVISHLWHIINNRIIRCYSAVHVAKINYWNHKIF